MIVLRSLRRAPLFAITSILTLALGIALVTAAFSLVDGVLLQPLPFAHADRVVALMQLDGQGNASGVSYPNFLDWQRQDSAGAYASMAYARGRSVSIRLAEGNVSTVGAYVSPGYLRLLQPRVVLGRTFTPDEESRGEHVVVLSNLVWQQQFHGDPRVLGRVVALDSGDFTVVGVLARGAIYPSWALIYLPLQTIVATDEVLAARDFRADSRAIARLRPGRTSARGQTELNAIAARLAAAYPAADRSWPRAMAMPVRSDMLGDAPSHVMIIAAAMALVLVIAWVNLINLALVRASGRARELAIRTSLGASRSRIVSGILIEQGVLSLIAAALGAYVATAVLGLLRGFAASAPGADPVSLDGRALAFAATVGVMSALVVGALPAWRAGHVHLVEPLKEGGGTGVGRRQQLVRSTLVAAEIAVALMLVIAAGLLVKSFWRLTNVDPGFDTHHLVGIGVSPPGPRYTEPAQAATFYRQVLAAVQAIPGVETAALTNHMPLDGSSLPVSVEIAGRAPDPVNQPQVLFRTLSPEYIRTLRIPLRRGRNFTAADLASGTAVMVNEDFARTFWPGADPLGKQVMLHKSAQGFADLGEPLPGIVVGVIGDVHHYAVQTPPVPEIYLPYTRNPWSHMMVVARARDDPAALIPAMRRAILGVDPATSLSGAQGGFQVIDQLRASGVSGQRFNMLLLGGFALCALLLSAIGIYGLMAYTVAQRTREMGIRIALGARASQVMRLVLSSGGRLIAVGVVVGLLGAFALTRLLANLLFGVGPTDFETFIITTAILASVALVACYLPARRASRVDPVVALRE